MECGCRGFASRAFRGCEGRSDGCDAEGQERRVGREGRTEGRWLGAAERGAILFHCGTGMIVHAISGADMGLGARHGQQTLRSPSALYLSSQVLRAGCGRSGRHGWEGDIMPVSGTSAEYGADGGAPRRRRGYPITRAHPEGRLDWTEARRWSHACPGSDAPAKTAAGLRTRMRSSSRALSLSLPVDDK